MTRQQLLLIALLLIGVTLAVFWPSLDGEFLRYDEEAYLTRNPIVQQGLTADGVSWAFSLDPATIYWHPLTWLSHMIDVELYGLDPWGHHLGSVLLHALCTVLLFLLLVRATGLLWPAAWVAALFSLHPLHVESVCWAAERKDVLSAFFWMLTLLLYGEYAKRPVAGRYALVLMAFALGLMAKPMLVTLPFVLLLWDVWPLRRVADRGWGRLVMEKLPLLVLAGAASVMAFLVQRDLGAVSKLGELPLGIRLGNAVVSYAAYLRDTVWPLGLTTYYPHPRLGLDGADVALAGAALLVISALVVWQRRRLYLPVGWLWYLGTLVPVIGVVQAGDQARADRFTYIPLIGVFVMVAFGLHALLAGWAHTRGRRVGVGALAGVVLGALVSVTLFQIQTWQNSTALWERAVSVTRGNYFAHNNLGQAYNDTGRFAEAAEQYSTAIAFNPSWPQGYSNLGNALVKSGRVEEGIAQLEIALQKQNAVTGGRGDDITGVMHYSMGLALGAADRHAEAVTHLQRALELKPEFPAANYALGTRYEALGDHAAAVVQFREALRGQPGMIPARNNLAVALFRTGDYAGAWEQVQACREQGFEPAEGFVRALTERMPEPR